MMGNIFDTQRGLASCIISIKIPVEKWIHTGMTDPEIVNMVKLPLFDVCLYDA